MTKRNSLVLSGLAAAVLVGGVVYNKVQTAKAASQPQFRTARAEKGDVTDAVEASGVVQPLTTVDVKSRAGGRIIKLAVDIGSRVKPGDLIARIDPSDTQSAFNQSAADLTTSRARLAQAQAQATLQTSQSDVAVADAEAALASARVKFLQVQQQARMQPALTSSQIRQARADLEAARENLRQLREATNPQARAQAQSALSVAQAQATAAEAAYGRQSQLAAKGFVAQQAVDTALAARDVARATLAQARQRLQTIDAEQQAAVRSAQARIRQAEAALQTAQTNSADVGLRAQDVAVARSAVRQAEAGLASAHAGLINNAIRRSDIQAARADVVKVQAAVENRSVQLRDATIYAPRVGVVLQKYVEEGTIITSGQSLSATGTSIVQIGDVSRLFADVSVDESDIAKISRGQKVLVSLDALPELKSEGRVTRINPQAVNDRDVTAIHVLVEIKNPDRAIKPGMNATCQFILRDVKNVLVVPSDAVKEDRRGANTVRVLGKDGKVEPRKVTVGVIGSEKTQIKSGLNEGEQVILGVLAAPGGGSRGGGGPNGGGPGGGGFRGGGR